MIPEKTGRVEIHLLLTIFVCILGLISTEHGRMVYAVKENPIDWTSLGLFTQQLKSRWYARDVNHLDYVSRIYHQDYEKKA